MERRQGGERSLEDRRLETAQIIESRSSNKMTGELEICCLCLRISDGSVNFTFTRLVTFIDCKITIRSCEKSSVPPGLFARIGEEHVHKRVRYSLKERVADFAP